MTATRVYVVRHGATELTAEDRFAGETDVPLSDVGRDQLRKLARRLSGEPIAAFYAIGTGLGGVAGPALFGALIETGSRASIFGGYLFGSGLMIMAAVVAAVWGVPAERKPLEAVARPLASAD